jgi:hypothetical protein
MKKEITILIGYILTIICIILDIIFSLFFKESIFTKFPLTFTNIGGFILLITIYYKYESKK